MKAKTLLIITLLPLLIACKGNTPQTDATEAPPRTAYPKECPATYTVKMDTTKGDIIIDVTRAWAPLGAQRFWELVTSGFYTDVAFFRVIEGFIAQAGIHGDPALNKQWRDNKIQDDPVKQGNDRGTVVFAMGGPNTRTTQFFINYRQNTQLDGMGFAAFGKVRDMAAADKLYNGYGEGAPRGRGPSQMLLQTKGNDYLKSSFPQLDYIKTATIVAK